MCGELDFRFVNGVKLGLKIGLVLIEEYGEYFFLNKAYIADIKQCMLLKFLFAIYN